MPFARGFWIVLTAGLVVSGCQPPPTSTNGGSAAPAFSRPAQWELVIPDPPDVPAELVPAEPASKIVKVGVSLLTNVHVFYGDMEASMRETAAKYNVELSIQNAEFDQAAQMQHVQDFVAQKMDAIILCPVHSRSVIAAVRYANDAGIPVFTADIAAASGDVVCHVASNNRQGGELLGDYVANQLLPEGGKIAIVDFPTVTSVIERVAGFDLAIARNEKIDIVARPSPLKPDKSSALPTAQDLLLSQPELKVIFGINDDTALATVQAVQASEREVIVVGFDGTPEALAQLRQPDSVLYADVAQYPKVIGAAIVGAVVQHLAGEDVPADVSIPTGLIHRKSPPASDEPTGD